MQNIEIQSLILSEKVVISLVLVTLDLPYPIGWALHYFVKILYRLCIDLDPPTSSSKYALLHDQFCVEVSLLSISHSFIGSDHSFGGFCF